MQSGISRLERADLEAQATFNNRIAFSVHGLLFILSLMCVNIVFTDASKEDYKRPALCLLGSSFICLIGCYAYDVKQDSRLSTLKNSNVFWACAAAVVSRLDDGLNKLDEVARKQFIGL